MGENAMLRAAYCLKFAFGDCRYLFLSILFLRDSTALRNRWVREFVGCHSSAM